MNTVRVERSVSAGADAVRDAIQDVVAFTRAAGFDEVERDGDSLRITNRVGILEMELTLAIVDDPDAALAYEQRDGVFESMQTRYTVTPTPDGCEVAGETTFALDVAIVGDFLDATVIRRQRRKELTAQFDYLQRTLEE